MTLLESAEKESGAKLRMKCCFKHDVNAKKTYEKLRWAYGEHTLLKAQVFR
jgi:hypothetical protein